MKKEEAASAFKWLERHQKEIRDTGVKFICAHAISAKIRLWLSVKEI